MEKERNAQQSPERSPSCTQIAMGETADMKKPELTDVAWLGPKEEMDRASHRVGKCSECLEIICVEKAVTETENTQPETTEKLYAAFNAHVKLKHAEDFSQAA
jgi:hypothetical protein